MTTAYLVLSTLVIFATVAILFWLSSRSRASKRAISMARQVFPVWAGQGPFASGAESAAAMHNAYMVVMGPEQAEGMADAIAKHAAAFDRDPATWEETRRDAAQAAGPETADFVSMAKRAGAKDAVNESKMRQELQILSVKRQDETLAFAKSMMTSIEANQLAPDAIDLLAEILTRPRRQVSGRKEVINTLQCLLKDPDYLRPHFDSLGSEWEYEKLTAEVVRGLEVPPKQLPQLPGS
jgi:hypothetical protein